MFIALKINIGFDPDLSGPVGAVGNRTGLECFINSKNKWLDALHIAYAESGGADILLTTDDRMLRRAKHFRSQLRVRIENPYTWLEEIAENEHTRSTRS